MKTHLPLALRKALLTAIFAVAGTVYNAQAEETAQPVAHGDITTKNTTINESGSISVGTVTHNADNLSITSTDGDVSIEAIQTPSKESVDGLKVDAAGDLKIGESGDAGNGDEESRIPATITNASIKTGGDFTIGETRGAANIFTICGTETESSTVAINVGDDFVVNQSADIHPGGGSGACGDLTLTAGGNMNFFGRLTNILGGGEGSDARATLTATTGRILIMGAELCTLGEGARLIAMGEGGNVQLLNEGGVHSIAGDISTSGKIEVEGVLNYIDSREDVVEFTAAQGITITSRESGETMAYNSIYHADMKAADKGITMLAEAETLGNHVSFSSLTAEKEDITISGGAAASVTGSQVKASSGDVSITGGTAYVEDSTVEASGRVEICGMETEGNGTGLSHVKVKGQTINVGGDSRTSISAHEGGESSLTAEEDVLVTGTTVTVSDDTTITSTTGDVDITATSGKAAVTGGSVSAMQGTATIGGATETELAGVAVEGAAIAVGSGTGSTTIGSDDSRATTLNATGDITVKDENVTLEEDSVITSEQGNIEVSATESALSITGGCVTTGEGTISINGAASTTLTGVTAGAAEGTGATVDVEIGLAGEGQTSVDGSTIDATGEIKVEGAATGISNGSELQADAGIQINSAGAGITDGSLINDSSVSSSAGDIAINSVKGSRISGESVIEAETGSVTMEASYNAIQDSAVIAGADVTMISEKNVVASITAAATIEAGGSVTMRGTNLIYRELKSPSGVSIVARQGDIDVSGQNFIKEASLQAGGAVRITTGEGSMTTLVEDASIAGSSVTIAGDATSRSGADLAVVTGGDTLIVAGSITLNNVSVVDTVKDESNIRATEGGDIAIRNRVDIGNATLTAGGHIDVGEDHVLNVCKDATLNGGLSGSGDINKSGGDALVLAHDSTAFSGTIYANGAAGGAEGSVVDTENAGTWIEMTGAGVGAESTLVLKNTDLVVNAAESQIGTLDTTQDSAANQAATGGTLLADGSYTTDDNTRTDFTTVGSVLEVQQGTSGDVLHATGLKLGDATLIKLDAEVGADGQVSSDVIKASGTIDMAAAQTGNRVSPAGAPVTARVYVTQLGDAASAADGARTTIMEGTVASALNEDVLYDVVRSANGTYQRVLQDRNVHLENKGDRVDLVYSKNYRSAAKNAQQTAVAGVLQQLSDNFHHSEGTLAASDDTLARLIDAFDYTRSEAAAVRGLQSVAGSGNVLPRLMQFDASRHHLSDLRRQMALPVCTRTWKGAANRTSNTWITLTGAKDDLNGDACMGDYSRSASGFLLGADRSLTCNLRVGASLGYESASGSADLSDVDAETLFLDAYAVAVTAQLRHRVSVGLASSTFDAKRGVAVEAGYHSFSGQTQTSTDGLSLNFGYEVSSERQLNARSSLARFVAFNLSWHKLDASKDEGLGGMGLETSYDDEWQADVALGLQYQREFTAVRYEDSATFYATAELHLDLLNDRVSARNRFLGPDSGWEVKSMKRDFFYVELGAGVVVPLSPSWTATAGAAVEVGPEHTSVSGNAGVRYTF